MNSLDYLVKSKKTGKHYMARGYANGLCNIIEKTECYDTEVKMLKYYDIIKTFQQPSQGQVVKMEFEIIVPDGFDYVAVDEDGMCLCYTGEPKPSIREGSFKAEENAEWAFGNVKNWSETVKKFKE